MIQSISFKNGEPFVRFQIQVDDTSFQDAVYPGKDSAPVIATQDYYNSIEAFINGASAQGNLFEDLLA